MTAPGSAILVVAYYFAPDTSSGTHRSLHFARALAMAGYDVQILTRGLDQIPMQDPSLDAAFPWPERIRRVDRTPTLGERYRTLKGPPQSPRKPPSNAAGAADARRQTGPLGWLRTHLSAMDAYPDLDRGWHRPALRAGRELMRSQSFAAVVVSGPPWTGLLVAERLADEAGLPLIVDFRDPWTRDLGRAHDPYRAAWANERANDAVRRILRKAGLVLFNTPEIMARAQTYLPSPSGQQRRTILNGSEAPRSESERTIPTRLPLKVRHFGSAYQGRSAKGVVAALDLLVARGELHAGEVMLEFIGAKRSDIDVRIGQHSWGEVAWVEGMSHQAAVLSMQEPGVLLVLQPATFNLQIPTKVYEYLAAGNPLLVSAAEDSAAWALARQFPWTRRLDPADLAQVTAALSTLVADWRAGRLRAVRTVEAMAHLTKASVDSDLVDGVKALLSGRSRSYRES